MSRWRRECCVGVSAAVFAITVVLAPPAYAQSRHITMAMQETPMSDVMSMLARQERVNILMSDDIDATVSFNLYEVTVPEAIKVIASAAGYAVERRGDNYFIVEPQNAGKYATSNLTELETYRIQYADPEELEAILTPYLSEYGTLRVMADRMLIAVEDTPEFLKPMLRDEASIALSTKGLEYVEGDAHAILKMAYVNRTLESGEAARDEAWETIAPGGGVRFIAEVKLEMTDAVSRDSVWAGSMSRVHNVYEGSYMHEAPARAAMRNAFLDMFADFPDAYGDSCN